jgi:hypothetical protein
MRVVGEQIINYRSLHRRRPYYVMVVFMESWCHITADTWVLQRTRIFMTPMMMLSFTYPGTNVKLSSLLEYNKFSFCSNWVLRKTKNQTFRRKTDGQASIFLPDESRSSWDRVPDTFVFTKALLFLTRDGKLFHITWVWLCSDSWYIHRIKCGNLDYPIRSKTLWLENVPVLFVVKLRPTLRL